jgi:hypothetical protein
VDVFLQVLLPVLEGKTPAQQHAIVGKAIEAVTGQKATIVQVSPAPGPTPPVPTPSAN